MGLKDVLLNLNNLKSSGTINDYAICGGYACTFYEVSMTTYDLDVLTVLPSETDYHKLYEHFRAKGARIKNVYIYIEGMPVQFLPNYISPLHHEAIEQSNEVEFEGVSSKFVSREYLIALLLTSYRYKDKIRIRSLFGDADKSLLLKIIQRFDNEQYPLYKRYKEVLADKRAL